MTSQNIYPSNIQPPLFVPTLSTQAEQALSTRNLAELNLEDIFGDCFFTPDGETVFLSESADPSAILPSGEMVPAPIASRPVQIQQPQQQAFVPYPLGGGIATTGLQNPNSVATVMGRLQLQQQQQQQQVMAPVSNVPTVSPAVMANPPQQRHHLQFAATAFPVVTKRKGMSNSAAARERRMSDQQKSERRERNREHAKRSRIRKKFMLESLQTSVSLLKEENNKLRSSIREHLGEEKAEVLLQEDNMKILTADSASIIAANRMEATKVLDDPDFSFIKALQTAQQNFIVTDPSLPDNPIVYATQGFLNLTGYTLDQVLGRNCRFLQGPETDPKAVAKIRKAVEDGRDMSVCLLNYRVDGTTFWNQFFIAALRDTAQNITNYVGVQCKVSDQYAAMMCKKQDEDDAKENCGDLEEDEDDDEEDDDPNDDE